MSDSTEFCTSSRQLGAWQSWLLHTMLAQSDATAQLSFGSQLAHCPPPQSVSVSEPFLTLSPQPAAWQKPSVQTPLAH
jgi:hypothetical protein